ncbi:MAG: RHS repeat-associated core domain-containing protein [Acidobacteriota bacterium]
MSQARSSQFVMLTSHVRLKGAISRLTAFVSPLSGFAFKTPRPRALIALLLMIAVSLVGTPSTIARSIARNVGTHFSSFSEVGYGSKILSGLTNYQQPDKGDKGMPVLPSELPGITPPEPPSKSSREARVARIDVKQTADVVLESGERLVFAAIPLDSEGNAIHGLRAEWASSDPSVLAITDDGEALAGKPGKASLTASAGSKKEKVAVTVVSQIERAEHLASIRPSGKKTKKSRRTSFKVLSGATPIRGSEFRAHSAVMPQGQPEQLPDSEISSIYQPGNATGASPGKTPPGAQTRAAATNGTEMPGSSNFTFGLPVANLPGRGLNAALSLVYNSRLWNKSTTSGGATRMLYNFDKGWLAPGFQISLGQLRTQSGLITLIDTDGTRHEMINNPVGSTTYESNDGTFIRLNNNLAIYPDGTQVSFGAAGFLAGAASLKQPIKITDRHGNFILISYLTGSYGTDAGPRRISSIQDTMGRFVQFYYDADKSLVAITAPGLTGQADLPVMRFYYQDITVNQSGLFQPGITVTAPATARVIKYVYLASATESGSAHIGYRFDYSAYGMVHQSVQFRGMTISTAATDYSQTGTVTSEGTQAALTTYNYVTTPSNLTDAPTYTERRDDWAGRVSAQPVNHFSVNQTTGVSTVTAPDGTISETQTIMNPGQWNNGLISRTIIKSTAKTFSDVVYSWQQGSNSANPRISQVQTTNDAGQTKTVVYSYDSNSNYNNLSAISERDFAAPGTLGTELRRTETTYLNQTPYWDRGLIHLPTSVKVSGLVNGVMTLVSQSDYFYDETTPTSYGDIGTMMYLDPGTNVRANLTRTRSYPDVSNLNTSIDHTATYDVAGNVLTAQVACCQQKSFSYPSSYHHAYPTSVTEGSGPTLTSGAAYDFNTGLGANSTDENGQVTSFFYHASSLRPEHTDSADGGAVYHEYGDALLNDAAGRQHFFVKTSARLDAFRIVDSYRYLDGRGAVTQSFAGHTAANGWSTQDIEYDAMGRAIRTSNPYYSAGYGQSAINPTNLWSISTVDNLGRSIQVSGPSGDTQNPTTRNAYVAYAGTDVLSTDPAGKQRLSRINALNQLTDVWEIKSADSSTESITFPGHPEVTAGYRTTYKYNATDNLVEVTQSIPGQTAQNRYFKFDSMGRLTHERQVEQAAPHFATDSLTGNDAWSRRYIYNSRGLVEDAHDALQVNTHLAYDGLNRVSAITYSNGTPAVTYTYDQARAGHHNNGRPTTVTTAAVGATPQTTLEYDYEKVGRIAAHRQKIATTTYSTAYTYNAGGLLLSESYPSGRVMSNAYDEAGRLSSVTDGQAAVYSNGFSYAPQGGLLSETFGNGAIHAMTYNNALQPKQVKLTLGGTEQQRYDYLYGQTNQSTGIVNTVNNNGQLGRVDSFIAETKQWDQRFTYDALGRLSQAAEYRGDNGAQSYQAHYDYDRYGNRFQYQQNINLSHTTVQPSDIVATTNRFISNGTHPTTYDDAGNILTDTRFRNLSYTYDANNRQLTATGGSISQTSVYDAVGQRVQTTANSVTRQMVYDAFGQLIADYSGGVLQRENIYRGGQLLAVSEIPTSAVPAGLTAAPSGGGITLNWSAAAGANNYRIERKGAGGSYVFAGATASVSFTDNSVTGGSAYLYKVCSADGAGNCTSGYSNIGMGAAVSFTDDPLTIGVSVVKAQHVTELRQTVNAVRSLAGLAAATWTNPTLTVGVSVITAADVTDLREKLHDALVVLALQTSPYTDPTLATGQNGTLIKKVHFAELRLRATSGSGTPGSGGSGGGGLKYVMQDIQGSTRAVMSGGSVVARHDYLPFGEEIGAGTGLRASGQGYGATDTNRQKYALTERDDVTGLDHTWWRKYENTAGRWTSPDPYLGSMSEGNPQSFNRYSYVGNDPVDFVDPTGLEQCYLRVQIWNLGGKTEVSILGVWCEGNNFSPATPTRQVRGPQNPTQPPIDESGVRRNITNRLTNDCKQYIANLINETARQNRRNRAVSTNLLDIFDDVQKQGGFHRLQVGTRKNPSYSHIRGTIPGKNATVYLAPLKLYPDMTAAEISQGALGLDSLGAFHELAHLAGSKQYDDIQLSRAARALGGPALPTAKTNKDLAFSTYLEAELKRNCPP